MKFLTVTVAAMTFFTFSAAKAGTVESTIRYFEGTLAISEISVVAEDGKTTTYDVPAELSKKAYFSSVGDSVSFGRTSKCSPYLGTTAVDMVLSASKVTAQIYDESKPWGQQNVPVKVASTGSISVPVGSRVFGTCGGDGKTLTELSIHSKEGFELSYR